MIAIARNERRFADGGTVGPGDDQSPPPVTGAVCGTVKGRR